MTPTEAQGKTEGSLTTCLGKGASRTRYAEDVSMVPEETSSTFPSVGRKIFGA